MKKGFALLLVAAMILSLTACFRVGDGLWTAGGDTWAIYWYLCGSDLESNYGSASLDLEEMVTIGLPDNVTVVIEAGGANEWDVDLNPDVLNRVVYGSSGLKLVQAAPLANMGDASTLEDFLRFCNDNYPADHRAVIIWNHGGGSVAGIAFDECFGFDSLTLPEMRQAFEASDFGGRYEIIGFDACLMSTIDIVDTFDEYANWLVASEELEPGCGWDYNGLLGTLANNPGMHGGDLGAAICDTYYAACEALGLADTVTLSVVDLTKAAPLVSAYDSVGKEALSLAGLDPMYFNSFGRVARSAESYGGNNESEGYSNMVDMGDLVQKASKAGLLDKTTAALLSALDNAVYYKVQGPLRSKASGLSCYFNFNGDYESYEGFATLETSPAFVYYFDYALTGQPPEGIYDLLAAEGEFLPFSAPDVGDLEDHPVTITQDGTAVLNLGADIAQELVGVYFNLAYVDTEGEFVIFLGSDNDLIADWDNGVFTDNFRGVWGSIDGALVYMEVSDVGDGYQVYAVPILLNGEQYTLLVSYIYVLGEYRILGARRGIDDNGMADKSIRPLIPGDIVEPLYYVMPDLESVEDIMEMAVDSITVTADTCFEETNLGDGMFVYLFEMRDLQNNSYTSEMVIITVEDGEIYWDK